MEGYLIAIGISAMLNICLCMIMFYINSSNNRERKELLNRILAKDDVYKYIDLNNSETEVKKKEVSQESELNKKKYIKATTPKIANLSNSEISKIIKDVYMGE